MAAQGKVQYTNQSGLKFALSSRKNATTSDTDLYLSLQIPEKYGWGAVGIGDQMIGAKMFITYPSANGKGTTLSVRTATGHFEPELLQGFDCNELSMQTTESQIESGFVCYGIGDLSDFTSDPTSAGWIWAVGPFEQVESNDISYNLQKHSEMGTFTLNMLEAQAPSQSAHSANPTASGTVSHTIAGATASPTGLIPSFNPNAGNSGAVAGGSGLPPSNLLYAHSILLAVSFIAVFPIGVVLLRFGNHQWHRACQIFGFVACVAGLAIGVNFSMNSIFNGFNLYHQIIGMVAVALLLVQALAGQWHHINYKKYNSRTWVSWVHLILGKLIIPLGMINACLGYHTAGKDTSALTYGIVALVVLIALYVMNFFVWRRVKNREQRDSQASPETGSPAGQTQEKQSKTSRFFG